jgi:hypothetical protein
MAARSARRDLHASRPSAGLFYRRYPSRFIDNSILPIRSLCSLSESTNLAMDLLVESSDKGMLVTYSSISPDSGLMSFTEKLSFAPMTHSHLEGKNAVSRTRWISGFECIVRPLLANSFLNNGQSYADLLQIKARPSAGLFRFAPPC